MRMFPAEEHGDSSLQRPAHPSLESLERRYLQEHAYKPSLLPVKKRTCGDLRRSRVQELLVSCCA